MEMTKKRGIGFAIAASVMAFALAFSLAGCSGGQKESGDQKSDVQAEAPATRTFTDSLGREASRADRSCGGFRLARAERAIDDRSREDGRPCNENSR